MENEYKTKDLNLAACLYGLNKKLLRMEPDGNRNSFWFVFSDKDNCEKIVNRYWQKDLKIDAKTYADAFRSLKDMIFSKG